MSQPERELQVSAAFVALADTLVDDYDIIDLLDRLVAHSIGILAVDAAGILLGDARRELRAAASSSEDATTMELLALQADEGPCLDCYATSAPVSVPDIVDMAKRWPTFVAAAVRAGTFRSVHVLPLRLRGSAVGALSLFHRDPGPLPAADLALAQALADVATIGILQERAIRRGEIVNEQLQAALNSRVVIEQAKGVIAQDLNLSMDAAFDHLRRYARNHNLRLAEFARKIANLEFEPARLEGHPTSTKDRRQRR